MVQGMNHAFDDVINVGKVAFVLPEVEHVDGFSFEDILGEHE